MTDSHLIIKLVFVLLSVNVGITFWDEGTSTQFFQDYALDKDRDRRVSVFVWMSIPALAHSWNILALLSPYHWAVASMAGITYGMHSITVAAILNYRTLITSANALEAYRYRQQDLRIWALGLSAHPKASYRYRVWRFRRIIPRSNNPEHMLGPEGTFSFRHDIVIMHCWEQMLVIDRNYKVYIAMRAPLAPKTQTFGSDEIMIIGTGFINSEHVRGMYRMYLHRLNRTLIRNCESYLPKWWGKFICFVNQGIYGVQAGSALFVDTILIGIGAFEIRYNEDRVLVFTDLRYYVDYIETYANITPGEYYDYAYQYWGTYEQWPYWMFLPNLWIDFDLTISPPWAYYGHVNVFRPSHFKKKTFFPLGRK